MEDQFQLDMKLGPQVNKLNQQNLSLWGINLVGMLGLLNQWVKLLVPLPLLLIQMDLLQWVLVIAFRSTTSIKHNIHGNKSKVFPFLEKRDFIQLRKRVHRIHYIHMRNNNNCPTIMKGDLGACPIITYVKITVYMIRTFVDERNTTVLLEIEI